MTKLIDHSDVFFLICNIKDLWCNLKFQRVKLRRVDGDFEVHLWRRKPHTTPSVVAQPSLTHNRRPTEPNLPFVALHGQHGEASCPDVLTRPKRSTRSTFFSRIIKTSLILFNLTYTHKTQLLPQRHVYRGGKADVFFFFSSLESSH